MRYATDDLRVDGLRPLLPPAILMEEIPLTDSASTTVALGRKAMADVLSGRDDRLIVVIGPCSIHDVAAGAEYAQKLKVEADRLASDLLVVMRVYFEKPRTTVGWKGLINDPRLDGSFCVNDGLRLGRAFLRTVAEIGVPAGCEFLDLISPQFIADLVSWGAIGARTTESQCHRELASGLSMPVGFKNGTDGNLQIAIDACNAANHHHHFLSVTKEGVAAIVSTRGNPDCHVILRGANSGPNYEAAFIAKAIESLRKAGLPERVMVDCSHGNSSKDFARQPVVADDVAAQVAAGNQALHGVMIEGHLVGGRQNLPATGHSAAHPLTYGQSVTDACISWGDTIPVLENLAKAIAVRRKRRVS